MPHERCSCPTGAQGGSNDDARARVDIRRQKRLAALCISTVSIRARPHDEPLPVWIAPWRYASKRASAIDRRMHLHVNIRPSKRLAALCISTVSIRARPHDEPLPVWIAPWRYASKRASVIDRRTYVHVDIRPAQSLEALWFSTVMVRVWPGGNAVPRGQLPRQPVEALCISTVRASRQSLDQRVQARCPAGKPTLALCIRTVSADGGPRETRGFRCGYPPPKPTRQSVNFNGERRLSAPHADS